MWTPEWPRADGFYWFRSSDGGISVLEIEDGESWCGAADCSYSESGHAATDEELLVKLRARGEKGIHSRPYYGLVGQFWSDPIVPPDGSL